MTYASAGNLKEALRYYDFAIRLSPDLPGLYALETWAILNLSGDIAQARAAIEPALRLKFDNDPSIGSCRAVIDLYAGAFEEAIERLSSETWEAVGFLGGNQVGYIVIVRSHTRKHRTWDKKGLIGTLDLEPEMNHGIGRNALPAKLAMLPGISGSVWSIGHTGIWPICFI